MSAANDENSERPAFSRLAGGLRVGADWFERAGLARAEPAVRGVVDRLEDLSHPGFPAEACARVHPSVRAFFERTGELDLVIESRWHPLFLPVWWVLRPVLWLVGQLVLPWRTGRVKTRVLALDRTRDGRADARGVVRTYDPGGGVMQVFAYATLRRGGVAYMSAAIPLPLGHLAGLLRLDPGAETVVGSDAGATESVALTTWPDATGRNAGGVWYVTRWFALRMPLAERLAFWAPRARDLPLGVEPGRVPGCTLVGRHEQWLFGVRVATHAYWFSEQG